jgi:hypothetical protein
MSARAWTQDPGFARQFRRRADTTSRRVRWYPVRVAAAVTAGLLLILALVLSGSAAAPACPGAVPATRSHEAGADPVGATGSAITRCVSWGTGPIGAAVLAVHADVRHAIRDPDGSAREQA